MKKYNSHYFKLKKKYYFNIHQFPLNFLNDVMLIMEQSVNCSRPDDGNDRKYQQKKL